MTEQTARDFYGAAYDRATDPNKLEMAFKQLMIGVNSENPNNQQRALEMAARNESAAFA